MFPVECDSTTFLSDGAREQQFGRWGDVLGAQCVREAQRLAAADPLRQPGRSRTIQRLGDRTARHSTTGRDLSVAEPAGPFQSQNVFDLSHGHSLRWHRSLLHKKMEAVPYRR